MTVTAASPNGTGVVTCPQFNPSQGHLSSYTIGVFGGQPSLAGGTPQSGTFTVTNVGTAANPSNNNIGVSLSFAVSLLPGPVRLKFLLSCPPINLDWEIQLHGLAGILQILYTSSPSAPTPEPATVSMVIGGLALFAAARRKSHDK